MAKNNSKKRQHSPTVTAKRQAERAKLAGEKARAKTRWNPAGRALLYGDLVFLAVSLLLESEELISEQVSGACTVLSFILLLIALWLLFGKKRDGDMGGNGPRL